MRRALLVCGCLTLAAVWLGPLPQLARQAFLLGGLWRTIGLLWDPAHAPEKEA
jgi:hypothetical protein